jgi:hypothetical protein
MRADRGALGYILKNFQGASSPSGRRPQRFIDYFPCHGKPWGIDGTLVDAGHNGVWAMQDQGQDDGNTLQGGRHVGSLSIKDKIRSTPVLERLRAICTGRISLVLSASLSELSGW